MAKENAIFRRNGKRLDYVCTANVAPGDVIKMTGGIIGVAEAGGVQQDVIALTTEGVFEFVTDAAAITQGAPVYLKADGKVSATKASNTFIGVAWSAGAATSGATVLVKINCGVAGE